ncbi:hypothetical protein LTS09_006087 [Friedmanniomyces endolithicus]|nr:hypothetical protein LTS09_006087 [Friedmanniomyces endolithicus]
MGDGKGMYHMGLGLGDLEYGAVQYCRSCLIPTNAQDELTKNREDDGQPLLTERKVASMLNECLLINTNPVGTLGMLRNVTQSALDILRLLQVKGRHKSSNSKRIASRSHLAQFAALQHVVLFRPRAHDHASAIKSPSLTMRPFGSRKRKKKERSCWPTLDKTSPIAQTQKTDPAKPSLLLDLPPEPRNLIYEAVLASTGGAKLSAQPIIENLGFASSLPRTNKQIRDEFVAAAWLSANIHTTVPGFSFRHVVTFLNRLPDVELRALPSITLPAQRRVVIEIIPLYFWDPGLLDRWTRRAAHPTKKGTQVNFEYRLQEGHRGHVPLMQLGRHLEYRARAMEQGREREEMGKIGAALRKGTAGT